MKSLSPLGGIPPSVFETRRDAALRALGDGVMVLPAAPVSLRSRDTEFPYRPDSELFYLTGLLEPETVAVLVGGAEPRTMLFVRERDPEAELWSGPRMGPDGAAEVSGVREVHPRGELEGRLAGLLGGGDRIHVRLGRHPGLDAAVVAALAQARSRGARTGTGPRAVVDPGEILDEFRLRKDVHELQRMRAAAALTLEGHRAGVGVIRAGAGEWEVEAAIDAAFRTGGGSGPGYETIVGSGPNACVLHYVANSRIIEDGDLVLVDAGAEFGLYQGDVTRVYPASGTFTAEQRAVYEVVDAARVAGLARVAPGVSVADVHRSAVAVLAEGLVALGVLSGPADDVVAQESYRPLFPHQTSHWLGLDVHDPGDYTVGGASRVLEPGMVLTVEPGLYFPAGSEGGAARFAGMGVRLEDDILVTEGGGEILTAALPTAMDAIEGLLEGAR